MISAQVSPRENGEDEYVLHVQAKGNRVNRPYGYANTYVVSKIVYDYVKALNGTVRSLATDRTDYCKGTILASNASVHLLIEGPPINMKKGLRIELPDSSSVFRLT